MTAHTSVEPDTAEASAASLELFETMWVPPDGELQVCNLPWHLARMSESAGSLSIPFDRERALQTVALGLTAIGASPAAPHGWRLRLALQRDGGLSQRSAVVEKPPTDDEGRVLLGVARSPWQPGPLSRHKTNFRGSYDEELVEARRLAVFDMVCHRHDGRLFDGARSTIFLLLGGRWLTPRIEDGALAGTCRARALEDGLWGVPVAEAHLWLPDLRRAADMAVGNALLGPRRAKLLPTPRMEGRT